MKIVKALGACLLTASLLYAAPALAADNGEPTPDPSYVATATPTEQPTPTQTPPTPDPTIDPTPDPTIDPTPDPTDTPPNPEPTDSPTDSPTPRSPYYDSTQLVPRFPNPDGIAAVPGDDAKIEMELVMCGLGSKVGELRKRYLKASRKERRQISKFRKRIFDQVNYGRCALNGVCVGYFDVLKEAGTLKQRRRFEDGGKVYEIRRRFSGNVCDFRQTNSCTEGMIPCEENCCSDGEVCNNGVCRQEG